MAATKEDVDRWIATAKEMKAKYIISVCDTFDWDDYPVYAMSDEDLAIKRKEYYNNPTNMMLINEIITIVYP